MVSLLENKYYRNQNRKKMDKYCKKGTFNFVVVNKKMYFFVCNDNEPFAATTVCTGTNTFVVIYNVERSSVLIEKQKDCVTSR